MEVILSTAFGVKAETQTLENDPITELAKRAMAPHPLVGIMCRDLTASFKGSCKQTTCSYPVTQTQFFQSYKASQTGYGAHFVLKETLVIQYFQYDPAPTGAPVGILSKVSRYIQLLKILQREIVLVVSY